MRTRLNLHSYIWLYCSCLIMSCTVVKNYPTNKPFVFSSNVQIKEKLPKEEKRFLIGDLAAHMDTSLVVKSKSVFGVYDKIPRPSIFDTAAITRSNKYMLSSLQANGYNKSNIENQVKIDSVKDQLRAKVEFKVTPGVRTLIDEITYQMADSGIQQLTERFKNRSTLKSKDPFTINNIDKELDRLVTLYRNHGYYKMGREDVFVLADTTNVALVSSNFDFLEQAELIAASEQQQREPTADISFQLKKNKDSTHLIPYKIGYVNIYPDYQPELGVTAYEEEDLDGIRVRYREPIFRSRYLPRHTYLKPGALYAQRNFYRTLNRLNGLGSWKMVNVQPEISTTADSTVDFNIYLTPEKKYSFIGNIEGSRNTGDIVASGNLLGFGTSLNFLNRRFVKSTTQFNINFRFGIEVSFEKGSEFLQTTQNNYGLNWRFNRPVAPFGLANIFKDRQVTTNALFNYSNINRILYYKSNNVTGSWGYNWQHKKSTYGVTFPNFESYRFFPTPEFVAYLDTTPELRSSFRNGMIFSIVGTYGHSWTTKHSRTLLFASAEESGLFLGAFKDLDRDYLNRFLKLDVDIRHFIESRKTSLGIRFFAGAGFAYGRSKETPDGKEVSMPFFRQYFGGGPNSMRAWSIRQLGPGSSPTPNTRADRFGDIMLETNVEFRFPLAVLFGVKLNSALYVDAGNVWLRQKNQLVDESAIFRLSKLGNDIAIGTGTGLRIDFDFFLIRFDYAWKIKDPQNLSWENGWIPQFKLNKGLLQLGIGYPF